MAAADARQKETDLDDRIGFLKKVGFFDGFDDNELRQFLQVSKWLRVHAGTQIIKENAIERAFYILIRGEARVEKILPGKEKPVLLTTLVPGDCFGEMALVADMKRTANVVAGTESFVLMVEPEIVSTSNVFLQLKFYKRFCELLVARLDRANRMVADREGKKIEGAAPAKPVVKEPTGGAASGSPPARPVAAQACGKIAGVHLPPMPDREKRLSPAAIHRRITPDMILPVNPAVAVELGNMLKSGAALGNTRRLAELISSDPALACRLLQTANSPFYRRATMTATVPLAIVIVGVKQVQELMQEAIRAARPVQAFGGFAQVGANYWRHAVLVGRIAEMLRETIRVSTTADVYLCGLLHDLGTLILDSISPDFYPQFIHPSEELQDMIRAEHEYVGVDHCQAGFWLGESIGLPQPYLDILRFHHLPEKTAGNKVPVALVTLANLFAALKGASLGRPAVSIQDVVRSFAWVIIEEHHRPFQDVNAHQFAASFAEELDKAWDSLNRDILL